MALPQRAPKPEREKRDKRDGRWKSQAHRDWVRREFACVMCGSLQNRQFAHVRMGSNAGMARKPDDWRGVCLCGDCHTGDQHMTSEPDFWRRYQQKHGQTVWQLIDSLCAASPRAAQIRAFRKEQNDV